MRVLKILSNILAISTIIATTNLIRAQSINNALFVGETAPLGKKNNSLELDYATTVKNMGENQNFYWLVEGVIAGMAQPHQDEYTLAALKKMKIDTIISLNGFEWPALAEQGFYHDIFDLEDPIDIKNPPTEVLKKIIKRTTQSCHQGNAVVIHCQHGISRTGALLALWHLAHLEDLNELVNPSSHHKDIPKTIRQHISKSILALNKSPNALLLNKFIQQPDLLKEFIAIRHPNAVEKTATTYPLCKQEKTMLPTNPSHPIIEKTEGTDTTITTDGIKSFDTEDHESDNNFQPETTFPEKQEQSAAFEMPPATTLKNQTNQSSVSRFLDGFFMQKNSQRKAKFFQLTHMNNEHKILYIPTKKP